MNSQTTALLQEILHTHLQTIEWARTLTNEDLDRRVPAFGGREIPIRTLLYQMVAHPREHAVHITKILQQTGAPGGQATEAQMILGLLWQSLAELLAVGLRLEDADLPRTFENQTIAGVLEHVKGSYRSYARQLEGAPRP